ncbi:MAG: hypothetical protein AUK38_05405 [Nitrospirae bacterium CG2_30_41_42]|nr:MAG: hypothetical protein AUK38_05405 [Nitrospirae bacterium CG2_30_41_42]PIW86345.1 MAG: hypothetical protein COZ94_10970 [Nitrospirae bacterium CG_4_8_14_3_um_filter_41_47]
MRKILIIGLVALLPVVLAYGFADATITATSCVTCHTMHNSQGGTVVVSAGPQEALVNKAGCTGCHAQNTASNIITGIPQVLHTGTDLAAGNFSYASSSQTKVHNVDDLGATYGAQDTVLLNNPPGYLSRYDPAARDFNTSSRLKCAGQNGCHGDRDQSSEAAAVRGGHHTSDSVLKFGSIAEGSQGRSVATSYRFLYKVKGGEETSWSNTSATVHNEYKGAVFARRTRLTWGNVDTISELCSECHGNFHASTDIGSASPWLRHPTDVVLPSTGEYASTSTTYNIETPLARQTITTLSDTITPGRDIVMCLSCHKAHGSEYADILRFDYSTLAAGTGCLRCHTGKSAY